VVFFATQNATTVAGAEVLRLSAELRAALDVDVRDGVFVVQVARSTPAERAGLRQGDVLLRAGGITLTTPQALQRAVAAAADSGAGGIRIELLRAKRPRTVEMRW
jgi:serine protease Do